jgi:hypothetical protein
MTKRELLRQIASWPDDAEVMAMSDDDGFDVVSVYDWADVHPAAKKGTLLCLDLKASRVS